MAKKKAKKIGSPTKYKATHCQNVDKYIDRCNNTPEGEERKLPTRAGVAVLFRVSLSAVDAWEKKYDDFKGALRRVKANQQEHIINRCMNGTGNATIGKMLLSANHGMHERQETEHRGEIGLTGLLASLDGNSRGRPE